jgi:DHA1 family multidrug resistance protein-like MFS transporter
LRLLQGVFSGYSAPSLTLVSVAAPASEQGRVSGAVQTASVAGTIIGPLLAAGLEKAMPFRYVFLVVAALSLVSAVLVFVWASEDPAHRQEQERGTFRKALEGSRRDLVDLWENDALRASLGIVFWTQFALGASSPLLDLLVRDLLHESVAVQTFATGALFSAPAAISLFAMPLWGRSGDRHGHAALLVTVGLWSGLALIAQGLAPFFILLLIARLVFGAAMAGSTPLSFGLAAREAAVHRRGGAFGVVFGVRTLAVAVSAMLGGWVSRFVGVRGLLVLGGLIVLASAWWMKNAAQRRASLRSTSGG